MKNFQKKSEWISRLLIVLTVVGLPLGILAYDRCVWPKRIPPGAKVFTLTGHAERGWLLGEVAAYDTIRLWWQKGPVQKPAIEVSKGDLVVLKLRSSDVTHGFSLKAFGVYITTGIKPGKTVFVSFKADHAGTFLFSCNVFCGRIHPNMQGTLIVRG